AKLGIAALFGMVPARLRDGMPFLQHLNLSLPVLGFTIALAIVVGVLFGLAPALRSEGAALHLDLAEAGRGAAGSHRRLRDALIVAEVAIAATLLVSSGLLVESLLRVVNVDPGFNRHNLLVLGYSLPPGAKGDAFLRDALREVGELPGVAAVGVTSVPPLACPGPCNTSRFQVENEPAVSTANQPEANNRQVSSGYFQTLQARLLQGRQFTERDMQPDAPLVAIVNRTLADKYYRGNALGKHFTFTCCPGQKPREIVGVVGDIQEGAIGSQQHPALYTPAQSQPSYALVIRTAGDPASYIPTVRKTLLGIDPKTVVFRASSLDAIVETSMPMFLRRLPAILVTVFGSLALLLAAIGIYGVLSYSVAQRTREFGIRMALGAGRRDLLRIVLNSGLKLVLIGMAVGLLAAAALARVTSSMLFGVRSTDPLTYSAAAALVALIATAAMLAPALRAARLDPLDALRSQ
ncbi:MAG TPA: FtsX-like permease family protein, partial [Terriglobales bacterium]|nr:FtsX-like permease family protein [Terriglobales bacterium]